MNRVAARITPELDLDPRLERVQDYLRLLGLDIEAQTRMLAELDRRLGTTRGAATQDRADELFDLVHQLLREHADDRNRTDAADDVASIPARIGTRFGSFGYQPWQGWPRLVSMPAIRRGHMRPPALDRNLLNRLLAALRDRKRPRSSEGARLWRLRFAAKARQLLLLALVAGPAFVATAYLATVLPHQGGTALELAIMVASFALFGWILVGFWNAVAGFRVIFGGDRFALRLRAAATTPLPREVHTAVVMPICHEEVARVFAGMQAVWTSLEATGRSSGFHFFVLSDSSDPDTCVAEEEAWADMCRKQASSGRLFYRRRRTHAKRKNGNIADFCRRWGGNYRYMIVLDADSIMSGDTLVRLVQAMELHPEAGLIQTQPIAVNRISPVARVQQFALRAYGPLFAAGLHFWHLDNAHYWGHNAIIRVAPFMAHCSLPRLPARRPEQGDILSHDFVEAAFMRRAGWGVYLAFGLGGSFEEMPPTLLDELKRDRRWCQGNFQHLRLLFSDRLNPAHRALFANGVMAYASALLWLVFLGLSSLEAGIEATRVPDYFPETGSLFPSWPVWQPVWALSLFAATMVVLFLPKVLGLAVILVRGEARSFGGAPRLLTSALLEVVFTMLVAPIRMLSHARFVTLTLLGRSVGWGSQPRSDIGVPWGMALRYHGPGMVLAAVWGGVMYHLSPSFSAWLLPILLPLLLAPVVTVYSSRPQLGRWLRSKRLFLIPEEVRPPRVLRQLRRNLGHAAPLLAGFTRAVLDPSVNALHCALNRHASGISAQLQSHRSNLIERALREGPSMLSTREKAELLADGDAMAQLHRGLWTAPRWPWPQATPQMIAQP